MFCGTIITNLSVSAVVFMSVVSNLITQQDIEGKTEGVGTHFLSRLIINAEKENI